MKRRLLLRALPGILLLALVGPGLARASPVEERINVFRDLVEAVGAAGDALKSLAEGIKRMVVIGVEGYDAASARITHARLQALSKSITDLSVSQRITVETFSEYVNRPDPSAWARVIARLGDLLGQVQEILTQVKRNNSTLVLLPAYESLSMTLSARVGLIEKLRAMPPPMSAEELKELRVARDKYRVLIEQLREARDQLNAYLLSHPA